MTLADAIRSYYFAHFEELRRDKKFHFATRLAAWEANSQAMQALTSLRPEMVPADPSDTALAQSLQHIVEAAHPSATMNAAGLRTPFFAKYPALHGWHLLLFRVRHLQAVYGIDARRALEQVAPLSQMIVLEQQLLHDREGLSILSTFAVNYIFLLEKVVRDNKTLNGISLDLFYDLGDQYDISNPDHLQLFIYLYTHCIINDTNFYTELVAPEHLAIYQRMLTRVEQLVQQHYDDLHLDNKLELLVCARMCGFTTTLFDRILAECDASLSKEGTFLVDTHNRKVQPGRQSFITSEHRNVLYIMSTSPYTPHSTLVQ